MVKCGDRVVVLDGYYKWSLIGKEGTCVYVRKSSYAGIQFDDFIAGHDCDGYGEDGYCWFIPKEFIGDNAFEEIDKVESEATLDAE